MVAPLHGGDLDAALSLARSSGFDAGERSDWLDLSTGINPRPYPVPLLGPSLWHRLPERGAYERLIDVAADYYGAPSSNHVLAAPGSALLIQLLPRLFEGVEASIVSPTYGDHERAWRREGHVCALVEKPDDYSSKILVLCHPNNPDGRRYSADDLKALAEMQTKAGGWLIVDEAFADLFERHESAVSLVADYNLIVLKSVGKFFGLAGMRLGFVIARPEVLKRLSDLLGSWAVSGPALEIGRQALFDGTWQKEAHLFLKQQTCAMRTYFEVANIPVVGGTDLFTLIEPRDAPTLFKALLKARIYVRSFDYNENWLRIGLPANEVGLTRLKAAIGG